MVSRFLFLGCVLSGWLLALAPASACNVPVFRYALERWRADTYEVVVFHRGPLTSEALTSIAVLKDASEGRTVRANFEVTTVDLAGKPEEAMLRLWHAQQPRTLPLAGPLGMPWSVLTTVLPPIEMPLPWVVIRYPGSLRLAGAVWSGPLSQDNVASLIESPTRKELAKRVLAGESAVWLLIESGDKAKDDATEKLLKTELARLEKRLKLPTEEDDPGKPTVPLLSQVPLKVKFSTLRLSRGNPAERVLLAMLLGAHDEVSQAQGEPIMFPIFGRGRALDAFVGKEINADVIGEVATFLCGACSCTVKQLNPGVDLLFAADWEAILETQQSVVVDEPKTGPGDPVTIPQPAKVLATSPPTVSAMPQAAGGGGTLSQYIWLGVGTLLLLLVVTASLAASKTPKRAEETLP
jgi:hypothetical protein